MVVWVETKEFNDVFEETIALLSEVKERVEDNIEKKNLDAANEALRNYDDIDDAIDEMKVLSNLTVCLTSITSWLILNKAFWAGEIELSELIKEGRLILDLIKSQNYDEFFAKNFGNEKGNTIARIRHLFGLIKELIKSVEDYKE